MESSKKSSNNREVYLHLLTQPQPKQSHKLKPRLSTHYYVGETASNFVHFMIKSRYLLY